MKKQMRKIPSLIKTVRNYYVMGNTLILLIFGVCILGIALNILVNKEENTSKIVTEQAALSLNNTFNDIISQMVSFSSHKDLINKLGKNSLSIQEKLNLDRELNTLLKKTDVFNSIVQDIFVIADNGYVFSTATQLGLAGDYNFLEQEWYQEAKTKEGNVYVKMIGLHPQDFYFQGMSKTAEQETFSMSFALENSKGKVIGALLYNFNLEQIADSLSRSNYEEKGKLALLDENGVIISQSNNREIGERLEISEEIGRFMAEEKEGMLQGKIGSQVYLMSFQTTTMGLKLISYVPQSEIWKHTQPMAAFLILTLLACLIMNLLIAVRVTRSIRRPIQKLMDNIQRIESEHLELAPCGYQYEELDQIAEKFSQLLDRIDTLIQKDYKSRLLLNKFRLYSLQSQINPHFLMNTLQQLQTEIVYGNVEVSNDIIVSLSKMLRYSLYHYEAIVPISLEVQYIQSYIDLFIKKYEGELRACYEIPEEIEGYCMPKLLLQPIVENCIMHAFEENPHNAVLTLRIETEKEDFGFYIEDNGSGIDEQLLSQILADINRPEIDDRRIGIRNIHQRIQLLYGKKYGVTLTSKKGEGTCFKILLPKILPEQTKKEYEEYMKLLIVDDQKSVHLYFDRMIPYARLGIVQVFHAANGAEALTLIEREWPEILIVDIRMPAMDGLELLKRISNHSWKHKVLILSAYNEFEYARQCIAFGVEDYLLKPIDNQEVIKSLRKIVQEITDWKKEQLHHLLKKLLTFSKLEDREKRILEEMNLHGYGVVCVRTGDLPLFKEMRGVRKLLKTTTDSLTVYFFPAKEEGWGRFFQEERKLSQDITIGFSRFHEGGRELPQAVLEGMEAVNQGFYRPGTYLYEKDKMKTFEEKEEANLSRRLLSGYQKGEIETMKGEVEKLFFLFERSNIHPKYVQDFCYGLLISLNPNFMETLKKLKGSPFGQEGYSEEASGMKSTFLRILINMRCEVAPEEVQTDQDVVKKIKRYIDGNYEKDLSLATLSKHFFISKYQISRLFKKQFEVNYSDYILQIRMEAAKTILKNTDCKIDEVARRVGFEESSYFSKVFSKYYGIAPGEYRNKEKGETVK